MINLSFSIILKFINLCWALNGSNLTHIWFCNILNCSFGKCWLTELYRPSKCWHISLYVPKYCTLYILLVSLLISWEKSYSVQFISVAQVSDSLRPYEPQHARPPYPSPTPGIHPNPRPLSRWCHPTISSSVVPFSSCPQYFPASGSFQMSQLFASGGQSIRVSASTSVLPVNTQDWSPLGWTGWISLQSKGLWRVFSNTTVQKHQFFGAQLSL